MVKQKKRVFVLDYDLVSPLGIGRAAVIENLKNNMGCGKRVTLFRNEGLDVNIAAEVPLAVKELYRGDDERITRLARYDRKFELLLGCYHLMKDRLHRLLAPIAPERKGGILGVGLDVTPFELIEPYLMKYSDEPQLAYIKTVQELNQGKGRLNTVLNPLDLSVNFLAGHLELGAFQRSTLTACTASTQAIALASEAIRDGHADCVVTGGADSILNLMSYLAFGKLGVILPTDGPAEKVCKPMDLERASTLVGEAAGLIVLASEEALDKIGVSPQAEILGYGNSLDGYKITSPDPSGRGMKRSIQKAIENSGIHPHEVDYANLHGTGTRANDPVELQSMIEVMQNPALPVSSTKDRHGHAISAAGVQEFAILALCMEHSFVPCTMNLENPIIESGIDLVMKENRTKVINIGMTNNFAFGGVNTVLVLKRCN